ncbi:hypothetical protein F0L16_08225 [Photorhabdus heterorhabditis]|uniref:Uncharacterized protein n=1 Tax=Photorhabdus heterorhabditis TaxID=880156 RepID=A0A5B0WZ69_9GAMM|nr:hypothetical protein F0L16_08225 [Photorhabdus heterorhabditis]MBS9441793.1 hypothetical protein [Photorhabdus heterorhabditis]
MRKCRVDNRRALNLLLTLCFNFAIASSFPGVTLGVFDYLADCL